MISDELMYHSLSIDQNLFLEQAKQAKQFTHQMLHSTFVGLGSIVAVFTGLLHPLLRYPCNVIILPIVFCCSIA